MREKGKEKRDAHPALRATLPAGRGGRFPFLFSRFPD
jgi:hypothetical protein